MNDFNTPLYPPNIYSNEEKNEEKSQGQNPIFSLLSSLGGESNNVLPLLLGMKNGNFSNILSLLSNKENPFSQIFSTLQQGTKKESQGSLKNIPEEEF